MRYIIISQPKAGTYLCANLLQSMGIIFEGYHLAESTYHKYDLSNLDDGRKNPNKYAFDLNFSESIKLIKDRHVCVTHIPCSKEYLEILKDYKKILLLRDWKSCRDSWSIWIKNTNRPNFTSPTSEETRENIAKWGLEKDVFIMNFEYMKNTNIEKLNELQKFLFGQILFDSKKSMEESFEKDSLTKIRK